MPITTLKEILNLAMATIGSKEIYSFPQEEGRPSNKGGDD